MFQGDHGSRPESAAPAECSRSRFVRAVWLMICLVGCRDQATFDGDGKPARTSKDNSSAAASEPGDAAAAQGSREAGLAADPRPDPAAVPVLFGVPKFE